MAPNKQREGDLRTRKMKLNTFINEDFRVGDAGQAGLPESTKTMLPLLGTAGDDGRLLTMPSTLAKFSKFVTNAHIFGSKVQLLSLIRLCEQFDTDYKRWPNVHKQQYYVQCSNRYATAATTFPPSIDEARDIIIPNFSSGIIKPNFIASCLLDDLGVGMLTDMQNHLKTNLERFLRRDITLHCKINHSSNDITNKPRKAIGKQILCVITARYFKGKMQKILLDPRNCVLASDET